jgi:prepilin-type N-terminal cleavage/methylation domain-containing protein
MGVKGMTSMVRKKNVGGFTLVEVLVGVAVAAIGLVALYAASTQCLKQIWSASEISRAALIADYEMENLCTKPWSNITGYGSSYTMTVSNNPALALLTNSGGVGSVQLASIAGNSNVIQATVTVTWTNRNGSLKTNSTALIISKNNFLL